MKHLMVAAGAALAMAACTAPAPSTPTQQEIVARGEYLVTGVVGCNDCHTPMTPQGPDMTRSLQGADLVFGPLIEIPWGAHAPALAGIPGNFTEEELVSFLQTGVRPDGSMARPPMPQFRLNEEDARAVVAYIQTLPPASDAPPADAP